MVLCMAKSESNLHKEKKFVWALRLKNLGCKNIALEKTFTYGNVRFRADVYAELGNERIFVEVGTLSKEKFMLYQQLIKEYGIVFIHDGYAKRELEFLGLDHKANIYNRQTSPFKASASTSTPLYSDNIERLRQTKDWFTVTQAKNWKSLTLPQKIIKTLVMLGSGLFACVFLGLFVLVLFFLLGF